MCLKFMVSDNYPENLLLDRLQTWNVHLFDETPEFIHFCDAFQLSVAKN